MIDYKLFSPGPVAVSPKTYQALTQTVMGHRSNDFVELYQSIQPRLQRLFYTDDPVFISTSSAWGAMEGALRNVIRPNKKVLNCMNGAFSDKWNDVAKRCGFITGAVKAEWGQNIDPDALRKALSEGSYDAVTLIHNETSTGVMNDLPSLLEVINEFPEVISLVDCVSSFTVVPVEKDALGIDILITGSQKALALPPGLALMTVSNKAFERAEQVEGRGYYFDFLEFLKNHQKGMTPSTPVIPLIFGLKSKLDDIESEGLQNRYDRHEKLNQIVHQWGIDRGIAFFSKEGYRSKSLTCFSNNKNINLPQLNLELKRRFKFVIDGGYGKIKGLTFRISNMGDETEQTIHTLLNSLNVLLPEFID